MTSSPLIVSSIRGCVSHCRSSLWVSAHPVLFKFVGNLERLGGADHGLHGGEDVLVNEPDEAPLVFVRVASSMDDPHLLDEGAFAAFSRT